MRGRRDRHAPRATVELATDEVERSWMDGWAQTFPGEPWPGLSEARRRIRARHLVVTFTRREGRA